MKINRSRVPNQCAFDRMVGTNLHYIRKYKKLSMRKVAEQIPFTFQQLQKYEKGVNTISAYKLQKLCNIYGATIDRIVEPSFIEKHQIIKERLDGYEHRAPNKRKRNIKNNTDLIANKCYIIIEKLDT